MYKLISGIGIAVAFIAVVGLGCGSSGEETASAEVTKAQFLKQANSVCDEAKKRRAAAVADWTTKQGSENVDVDAGLRNLVAPSLKKQAERLEGLTPPAEDEAAVAGLIAMLAKGSEVLEEEGQEGVQRSRLREFERKAIAFGLQSCANL